MHVFWDVVPCHLVKMIDVSEMFTFSIVALMMAAVSTLETPVNFYQSALRNVPEESHVHSRHHENLKSLTSYVSLEQSAL
jgi:hypothetical protein